MNTLEISTGNAKTDSNNRLSYRFKNSMHLKGYISLSNVVMWYNWKNITQALGNNKLSYTYSTPTKVRVVRDIVIPDGSYSIKDINNYIHSKMEKYRDVDTEKNKKDTGRYGINLYENTTYNRVSIELTNYSIIFGLELAKTLGTSGKKIYTNTSENMPDVPQIENVKSVQVHCSLVYNEYQQDNTLLYNFTPNVAYGSLLSVEPRFPQWRKSRDTEVAEIDVWLTDQNGKVLMLEDDWGITLQIAEQSLIRL